MSVVSETFRTNVAQVFELAEFDQVIIDIAAHRLETVEQQLRKAGVDNPRLQVTSTVEALRRIKTHGSLAAKYKQMHNQCVVLLASYFGSAVHDMFRATFPIALAAGTGKLLKEELRLTLEEVREVRSWPADRLGDWFLTHRDVSFQDLQSVARAFDKYLDVAIPKDDIVNDVIFGHAARHAIVHAGGKVDRRMTGQVAAATPRSLKPEIREGRDIDFSVAELRALGAAMLTYVERLEEAVRSRWGDICAPTGTESSQRQ